MIWIPEFSPYALDKNIGREYNRAMEAFDSEWIILSDSDFMFLTFFYGTLIIEAIKEYPDTALFTCYAQRTGVTAQRPPHPYYQPDNYDVSFHQNAAEVLAQKHGAECEEIKGAVAGFMMVVKKSVWKDIRFTDGIEGVDIRYCQELLKRKHKIRLIKGILGFHRYRINYGYAKHNHHLK